MKKILVQLAMLLLMTSEGCQLWNLKWQPLYISRRQHKQQQFQEKHFLWRVWCAECRALKLVTKRYGTITMKLIQWNTQFLPEVLTSVINQVSTINATCILRSCDPGRQEISRNKTSLGKSTNYDTVFRRDDCAKEMGTVSTVKVLTAFEQTNFCYFDRHRIALVSSN
jgi:hypothetical protein